MKFGLKSIDPDVLSIAATLIAIAISQSRNADQLNVIGNFIVAVGGLILTEAAQISSQQTQANNAEKLRCIQQQLEQLSEQLSQVEKNNR